MADHDGLALVPILLGVTGLLAFAGGTTLLVTAVRRSRRERRATRSHASATGRVVERFLPSGSAVHSEGPRYTIAFTTAGGEAVRFTTDSVGWTPKKVGDAVEVLYNPAAAEDAFVRGGERAAAWLMSLGGAIFTIVGLLMALSALDQALQ